MKKLLLIIIFCFFYTLFFGQSKYLHLTDTAENPISGSIVTFLSDKDCISFTAFSDIDGIVFLSNPFHYLTISSTGYVKTKLFNLKLHSDTTVVILKGIRYSCPLLVINKKNNFVVDTSGYNSSVKYFFDNRHVESLNVPFLLCDTLAYIYDCPLAKPKTNSYKIYYQLIYENLIPLIENQKIISNEIIIDFFINRQGEMTVEEVIGINSDVLNSFKSVILTDWKPALMIGKPVLTRYRIKVSID
jgi:hypothetical protein